MAVRGTVTAGAAALCEATKLTTGATAVAIAAKTRGRWRVLSSTDPSHASFSAWSRTRGEVWEAGVNGRLLIVGPLRAPLPPLVRSLTEALAARHQAEVNRRDRELTLLKREHALIRGLALTREEIRKASHDLRTPLSVMKGYLDMLSRGLAGPLTPQMVRYLERLNSAVERQQGITTKLLGSAARRSPLKVPFDLRGELVDMLGVMERAGLRRGIRAAPLNALSPMVIEGVAEATRTALQTAARLIAHELPEDAVAGLDVQRCDNEWRVQLVASQPWTAPARVRRVLEVAAHRVGGMLDADGALRIPCSRACVMP